MSLPVILVRVGSDTVPLVAGVDGAGNTVGYNMVDQKLVPFAVADVDGVVNIDPAAVYFGVDLVENEQEMRMAAEHVRSLRRAPKLHPDERYHLMAHGASEPDHSCLPCGLHDAREDRAPSLHRVGWQDRDLVSLEEYAATFLANVEGDGDPYDFQHDPRLETIVRTLYALGLRDVGTILGAGTFGTAALLDDRTVIKITSDPSEVQAGSILKGKRLKHVARIYESWFIRGVRATTIIGQTDGGKYIKRRYPVGVLYSERVTPLPDSNSSSELTILVNHFKEQTHTYPHSLARLDRAAQREKLKNASLNLERTLRQQGVELRRVDMMDDVYLVDGVADALRELRDQGVYAIDVHAGNVGYVDSDSGGIQYKVFDIGSSSPPARPKARVIDDERVPEQLELPGMFDEGVGAAEWIGEGSDELEKLRPRRLAREGRRNEIPPEISQLLPDLVKVAQKEYDDWKQDETGYDEEVGGGGICHLIADKFVDLFSARGVTCTTVSSNFEVHVYTVLRLTSGVWEVDIRPYVYERGGGYTWTKIPDVNFDASDITVNRLSPFPRDFKNFVDAEYQDDDEPDEEDEASEASTPFPVDTILRHRRSGKLYRVASAPYEAANGRQYQSIVGQRDGSDFGPSRTVELGSGEYVRHEEEGVGAAEEIGSDYSPNPTIVDAGAEEETSSTWYHLTGRSKFTLDPKFTPADNALAIEDRSGRPGIYLGRSVETWVNGFGYWRPFVVEIKVDPSVTSEPGVRGRWGDEMFVPASSFDKLTIQRVIPLDAYAREEFGEPGWIESSLGVEFDTGDPVQKKYKGYRYPGPDVRAMPSADVARLKTQLRQVKGGGAEEAPKTHRYAPQGAKFTPIETLATGEPFVTGYTEVRPQLMKHRDRVPSVETIRLCSIFAISTIRVQIDVAERRFDCLKELWGDRPGAEFEPWDLEAVKSCFQGMQNGMGDTVLNVSAWAPTVHNAIGKKKLKDRALRRYLAVDSKLPHGLGMAKLSFTLALLGHDTVCLDSRLLDRMFGADGVKIAGRWDKRPDGTLSEEHLKAYEAAEDAFLKGNAFYDPQDVVGRARCQWKSWEVVGGKPAAHHSWLDVVR